MSTFTRTIAYAIYVLIFIWLILYSALATIYNGVHAPQPRQYDIDNVTVVTQIRCTFPTSDQYHTTPRYIFYFLFAFVIIFRNYEWLTAGTAASVLTYSGVAAIHMILLFQSSNRFDTKANKTHCDSITLPGLGIPFLACHGINEPDRGVTFNIVSTALLGALPMAAWSNTFRGSSRKPIFLLWVLLLSTSHVFFQLTFTNVNYHFQVCPRKDIEPLPQADYQAPSLDPTWHSSLYALVSGQLPQQSTRTVNGTTNSSCLYSCFASHAYTGRTPREIGVYYQYPDNPGARWNGVIIWWAFTALGLITFFTAERPDLLPHVVHKPLFTFRPSPSIRILQGKRFSRLIFRDGQQNEWQISAVIVVRLLTQWLSAIAFIGDIIHTEARYNENETESLSAVGQWSGVAVVVQVLIAAGVSYLWQTLRRRSETKMLGNDTSSTSEMTVVDEEVGKEEWSCKVGYAS